MGLLPPSSAVCNSSAFAINNIKKSFLISRYEERSLVPKAPSFTAECSGIPNSLLSIRLYVNSYAEMVGFHDLVGTGIAPVSKNCC